jgi:ABC-type bacteriocin/lantibiotic exporter with double-glycine peptidase domain
MQKALASIGRINEFLRLEPEVQGDGKCQAAKYRATAVAFHTVSFAYKDRLSVNGESVIGERDYR